MHKHQIASQQSATVLPAPMEANLSLSRVCSHLISLPFTSAPLSPTGLRPGRAWVSCPPHARRLRLRDSDGRRLLVREVTKIAVTRGLCRLHPALSARCSPRCLTPEPTWMPVSILCAPDLVAMPVGFAKGCGDSTISIEQLTGMAGVHSIEPIDGWGPFTCPPEPSWVARDRARSQLRWQGKQLNPHLGYSKPKPPE